MAKSVLVKLIKLQFLYSIILQFYGIHVGNAINHDTRSYNKRVFETYWQLMNRPNYAKRYDINNETFLQNQYGNYKTWSRAITDNLTWTFENKFKSLPSFEAYPDVLYQKLQERYPEIFVKFNIALPLAMYCDETSFRINFFDVMKSLSYTMITIDHAQMYHKFFEYAWYIIDSVRMIREFDITLIELLQIQQGFNSTAIGTHQLHPSISKVHPTLYHGAYLFYRFYFQFDDAVVKTYDRLGDIFYDLGNNCGSADVGDPFSTVFRSLWVPNGKITNVDSILNPSNFNSWSLSLAGALTVAQHFLETTFQNEDIQLVILVAEADWSHLQTISKWCTDPEVACRELEAITPPFEVYQLDYKLEVTMSKHGLNVSDVNYDATYLSSSNKNEINAFYISIKLSQLWSNEKPLKISFLKS